MNNNLQGTQPPDQKPDKNPELLCDSTFIEYKIATDDYFNDDGTVAKDPKGNPIKVRDVFKDRTYYALHQSKSNQR